MPQQLMSYYLQTMGIDLWVRRGLPEPAPLLNVIAPKSSEISIMVVLEEADPDAANQWLAGKVGVLLTKMLHSIGLSSANTAIVCSVTTKTDQELKYRDVLLAEQVVFLNPKLILILGPFSTQCHPNIPVFLSNHPSDLLNNPIKKKNAFADWMKIKNFLE